METADEQETREAQRSQDHGRPVTARGVLTALAVIVFLAGWIYVLAVW